MPTTIASDTFSGTAGQDLTAYSASWSSAYSTAANQLECDGSGNARAAVANQEVGNYWNADTFDDDQYAEVTGDWSDNNNPIGVLVRQTGGGNGYGCYAGGSILWVFELNSNTWTGLGGTESVGITTGDHTLRLEAEGTTLRVIVDGIELTTRTDATHTSGAAGVAGFTSSGPPGTALIRSWEAGNLADPPPDNYEIRYAYQLDIG
jgi:hypothetical protein